MAAERKVLHLGRDVPIIGKGFLRRARDFAYLTLFSRSQFQGFFLTILGRLMPKTNSPSIHLSRSKKERKAKGASFYHVRHLAAGLIKERLAWQWLAACVGVDRPSKSAAFPGGAVLFARKKLAELG